MTKRAIIERMVDRVLYTVEQYTVGGTLAVSTLSQEEHDAMTLACEQQLETLLAQCLSLTREEKT
jgi:hypothetical protein